MVSPSALQTMEAARIMTFFISKTRQLLMLGIVLLSAWCTPALAAPTIGVVQGSLERIGQHVEKIVLSNGLRVIVFHRPQAPVFAGQVWVRVGGVDEIPGSTGISHMLEHMAFKGTNVVGTTDSKREAELLERLEKRIKELESPALSSKDEQVHQIQTELSKLWEEDEFTHLYQLRGADGLNAGTTTDYTVYMVKMPKTAFEFWCWMESERLVNPVFRQFYKEREVVLEERRTRTDDSPGGKMYEVLLATAYLAHPSRLPVIGWRSDLERLTASATRAFYDTYYRPDNMVIALAGDIDLEQARPMLEKYFGRIPKSDKPLPEVTTVEPDQLGEREAVVEFESNPMFMMAYHKPVFPHPDDAPFTILHELLSSGRSSLLVREFVQRRKIARGVYTSEGPSERFPTLFYVGASPVDGVTSAKLRDELQQAIDRVAEEGFREEDIAGAKRRLRVSFLSNLTSNYGMARLLARSELLWGDWKILLKFYDDLEKVTNEDIKRVLKEYITPSNRTFVEVVDKRSEGENKL